MTIEIRLAQLEDAAGILAIYAPYCESSTVTFETSAPSREEMADRIAKVTTMYPWLVADSAGQIAGYVYATRFRERAAYRWTAEVAVYIALDAQNRGLAQALYSTLFAILREHGFSKAVAGITMPNPSSVRLHEKLGFQKVGNFPGVGFKSGTWLDVGWWQLELQPESDHPADPRSFPTMRDDPRVLAALNDGRRLANR